MDDAARLDPYDITSRARQAYGADGRLPPPHTADWPVFPFEPDVRVRHLEDPVVPEPPRHGEDAADCRTCGEADDRFVWTDDRWLVLNSVVQGGPHGVRGAGHPPDGAHARLTSRDENARTRSCLLAAVALWVVACGLLSGWILGGLSMDTRFLIAVFLLAYPGLFLFVIASQRAEQTGYVNALESTVRAVIPEVELRTQGGHAHLEGSFAGRPARVSMSPGGMDGSSPGYVVSLMTDNLVGQGWTWTCRCKGGGRGRTGCSKGRLWGDGELRQRLVAAGVDALLRSWPTDPGLRCDAERSHPTFCFTTLKDERRLGYHGSIRGDLPKRLTAEQLRAQLDLLARLADIEEKVSRYAR